MNVQKQAETVLKDFARKTRTDKTTFWASKQDSTGQSLAYHVHKVVNGEGSPLFPDDWLYELIVEVLLDLKESSEYDAEDQMYTFTDNRTGIYHGELFKWLMDFSPANEYIDEAVEECGYPGSLVESIQAGQAQCIREVYESVVFWLENNVDEG